MVISCNQGNQTESIQPTGPVGESLERKRKNDKEGSHLGLTSEACLIGYVCSELINPLLPVILPVFDIGSARSGGIVKCKCRIKEKSL